MDWAAGLQTHFNAANVDRETLRQVRGPFNFRWARVDVQLCDAATMLAALEDVRACDLRPLPIVADEPRIEELPAWCEDAEYWNEPDGDIPPQVFRPMLDRACRLAASRGVRLWAPAISNLDRDSLYWLRRLRDEGGGWPEGLYGISAHRYGDGTFEHPHDGFASREEEVDALRDICNGLPFIITEFGYPSIAGSFRRSSALCQRYHKSTLSEAQQAERIAQEWQFWRDQNTIPFLYQLNDGPSPTELGDHYGIRRCAPDGTLTDWKPAAHTVPKTGGPMELPKQYASVVISKRESFPHPTKANVFATWYPKGQRETILNIEADGSITTRHLQNDCGGEPTAWQSWTPDGDRAVFYEAEQIVALPIVE